eukprot:5216379-Pyramimonas_sp.AAC.1
MERFPSLGRNIMFHLTTLRAGVHIPACLAAAEQAGADSDAQGWSGRPTWANIAAGGRPQEPPQMDGPLLGEWQHGWQFCASSAMEKTAHAQLKRVLGLPSTPANAASPGEARLQSVMGRFSAGWLLVAPTTDALIFNNSELQCAVRRRLGIA